MTNPSLTHLQLEMARLDYLIQRHVRLFQQAGQDPNDQFRGLYVSDARANELVEQGFSASLSDTVKLDRRQEKNFVEGFAAAEKRISSFVGRARKDGQFLRLAHMATVFSLDRFDLDAFLICLAPTLDLRYERIYGYLQDDITKKQASVSLMLDLLAQPGEERLQRLARFGSAAPLRRFHLLERVAQASDPSVPMMSQLFVPDASIVSWLLGKYQPHPDLAVAGAAIGQPERTTADEILAGGGQDALKYSAEEGEPIVVFTGPDQDAQTATARLMAAQRERPLLRVGLDSVADAHGAARVLRLALRDALLAGAVPYITGWDTVLGESSSPPAEALADIVAFPRLAVIAGRANWQPRGIARSRVLVRQDFPLPDFGQRLRLWKHFLDAADPGGEVVHDLATQFLLTTNQVRDSVASAHDLSAQEGRPLSREDLFEAARDHSNPNLGLQARKLPPRYSWDDIVLPADQRQILVEIINTVRGRPKVLEEWGVGKKLASSAGVTVLFAGDPGTGKTMAAEVMANELGLDLYKIDLSGVVSKYIGETEKNLERIFSEAQSSNAILFFDEADAIFGKRSEVKDAHDRYANIEVSYLLQRMEAYDGVTILATNLRANLDEAFTRRLQFAVDFPFPEEEDRLLIWETLFPDEVPRDSSLDLALLARRFKLAGGNIRNIIVSAAFLAASDGGAVTMQHMLHGARREMQKMGRLVNERDLEIEEPT